MMELADRVALVTGGARGQGRKDQRFRAWGEPRDVRQSCL